MTVILTSYNHERHLRQAIESVLHQTFSDFDLIIADDASTDGSWDIISSYNDTRIHTIRYGENTYGWFINDILLNEEILSDYIAIHHSDDIWEPQKLEKQVKFLDDNLNIGAVFTDAIIIGESNEILYENSIFNQKNRDRYNWLNHFFYIGNALCHPSILARRELFKTCGVYRYGLNQLGDFDLWIRLCFKYDIHVLPEKLMRLRVLKNNLNASAIRIDTRIRQQFEFLKILDNFRKIKTFEELIKIFPSAQKYETIEEHDIEFMLGLISLDTTEALYKDIIHLFGATLIFEALNDNNRSKNIEKFYGFTQRDFASLSGKNDIFSVELKNNIKSLKLLLEKKDNEIELLIKEKKYLKQLLLEIQNSRAWRVITFLRDVRQSLIERFNV